MTVLSGFVMGYGAVAFQMFGASPSAFDYLIASGAYAATGVVLAIGVPALLSRAPRWLAFVAIAFAVMYLAAGFHNAGTASSLAEEPLEPTWFWSGVNGVVWWPWTWPLLILGPFDAVRWLVHRIRPGLVSRVEQDADSGS
jgi:hypothetical protein